MFLVRRSLQTQNLKKVKKMATKKIAPKINDDFMKALDAAPDFLYAKAEIFGLPESKGLVQANRDMVTDEGIAVRLTNDGRKYVDGLKIPATPANQPVKDSAMSFSIQSGFKLPSKQKTGRASSIYKFDEIPAPTTDPDGSPNLSGFFVPATDEKPDPVKSLASTVNNASKTYSKETGRTPTKTKAGVDKVKIEREYERKFVIRAHEVNGVKGALVLRIK